MSLIMEKIEFGDWFILMQICKNIHPETFHHLVTDLREKYVDTIRKLFYKTNKFFRFYPNFVEEEKKFIRMLENPA